MFWILFLREEYQKGFIKICYSTTVAIQDWKGEIHYRLRIELKQSNLSKWSVPLNYFYLKNFYMSCAVT